MHLKARKKNRDWILTQFTASKDETTIDLLKDVRE